MKRIGLFVLLALVAFVGTLGYMRWVARERLELTQHSLTLPQWQGEELCLAVLADIHARPGDGEYLDAVVSRTLAEKPDAVVLLGDFMNGHHAEDAMPAEELAEHLRPLTALPCFAVLGNHDYYHGAERVRQALQNIGVQFVEGCRAELRVGGAVLDIGGIRCCYTHDTPGTVPQAREGVPLLLLSHTPVGAQYAPPEAALTLAGHSHGGQVCWPTGKPIWMADGKTPAEWAAGLVSVHGHPCYVTRGIGTSSLPIRFFCPPELFFLRLEGAQRK